MKIRFLVHDASMTGAPIVCLNFIKWIYENEKDIFVSTMIYRDGPLRLHFERYSEVFVLWKYSVQATNWFIRRVLQLYDLSRYFFYRVLKRWDVDYINSSAAVVTYSWFLNSKAKKILHVHEMLEGLKDYCGREELVKLSAESSFIISASGSVERDLWDYCGIKSLVIYEFVDHYLTDYEPVSLRTTLNIPKNALIIGGCGRASIRKGFDIFLEIAKKMIDGNEELYFVWIGSKSNATIEDDVLKTSDYQENRIFVLDETVLARSLMRDFDIFLIPSREDPFPLVAIENALNAIPLICFQEATGLSPLFKGNEDLMVKYKSVDQVVIAIKELISDIKIRKRRGDRFQLNAIEYVTDNQAPKIMSLLRSLS